MTDLTELTRLETIITNGLQTFFEVGQALLTIRVKKLYRVTHSTFEAYCSSRWDISRKRGYQLMAAAAVVSNLSTMVESVPTNERQARELVGLDPDAQRVVWQVVEQTAPGGAVTSAHIKSVVTVFRETLVTGAIDNGQGEAVRVHDLVKAVVTEETYERMQRQIGYITAKQSTQPPADKLNRALKLVEGFKDLAIPTEQRRATAETARRLATALTVWADELEAA